MGYAWYRWIRLLCRFLSCQKSLISVGYWPSYSTSFIRHVTVTSLSSNWKLMYISKLHYAERSIIITIVFGLFWCAFSHPSKRGAARTNRPHLHSVTAIWSEIFPYASDFWFIHPCWRYPQIEKTHIYKLSAAFYNKIICGMSPNATSQGSSKSVGYSLRKVKLYTLPVVGMNTKKNTAVYILELREI